jgi:hypothetical protein
MGRVSKESAAHVDDMGPAEDRHEDLEGYTVDFVSIKQDSDLAPMLRGFRGIGVRVPIGVTSSRAV